MGDVVANVTDAVAELEDRQGDLIAACTDRDGADLALMLADVREARERLYRVESELERLTGQALMDDQLVTGDVRVERYRSRDRKEWRHDDWQHDVRDKAMRKHGLLGALIATADGELLELGVLYEALAEVQRVHGAGAPKTTALRGLGLDAADYCRTDPGRTHVRVIRLADDQDQDGSDDD